MGGEEEEGREGQTHYVVEQFVAEVLDFSSQYGSDSSISYTAHNIVGRPSKFPSYGDFSQTFVMRDYGPWWRDSPSGKVWRHPLPCPQPSAPRGANFIDMKFEHAVYPFRIHVYETYNPGGLVGVWAGDCRGSWRRLWGGRGEGQPNQPRQFSPPIQPTDFPTRQIRLEFDQTCLPYYTEIDAVCLLGTLHPITPSAKVAAMLPSKPLPPILGRVVSSGLHVLPASTDEILEACTDQLSRPAVNLYIRQLRARERSPPAPDDGFFSLLPREILLSILALLDVPSMVAISQCSTGFRDLTKDPFLYATVDLRQVWYCCSSGTLDWLLQRSGHLTQLDLSWCGNYGGLTPTSLSSFLASVGPQLTLLRLDCCHVATVDVLEKIGENCTSLTHLSLANCHLLKPADFQALSPLEHLISLNLYRTSVSQTALLAILCNNRDLQNLNLSACPNIQGDEVCLVLSCCQPHLTCLDLWRCSSLTARGVAALAACTQLKDLDLGWCLGVQAATGALLSLIEACPGLTRLCLTAHRQTGDRELAALATLPSLEQLDILGNRNVSLTAVQELVASLPNLKLLDCSFCDQLGEQGVCQLRAQYPDVAIQWSFTDAG